MNKLKTQNLKLKTRMQKLKFYVLSYSFMFCILSFTLVCYARDIQLEVTVERTKIALGEAVQLNLTFHGMQNIPAPKLDKIEGFDSRYRGPSTMVSIVEGVVSSSITHVYTLVPLKTGTFTIGPLSIEAGNKTFTSKPINIEVVPSSARGQVYSQRTPQAKSLSLHLDAQELKDKIFLVMDIPKRKVYLNEIVPITVKLFVNQLGVRDIQFPEFKTTDFSIEKFDQPKQYRQEFGGEYFDVIEFATFIFGIKAGEFTLGPAKLKCNLVVRKQSQRHRTPFDDDFFGRFFNDDIFEDFFGRYEAHPLELKSTELPLIVLPLPQEGRTQGFAGALGDFKLEVEAIPLQVKAGDPVTVKMRVKGEGNFDTVNCPELESKEGFKVYAPQIKQIEGAKEFEQVLIVESEKVNQIPAIKFSFFNTKTGQYQVLTHNPISINVTKSEESQIKIVELPQAITKYLQKEELGRDIIYIKNALGKIRKKNTYLYQNFRFWVIQVVIFILFIGTLFFHRQQQRLKTDLRYARRLQAPALARKRIQKAGRLLRTGKSEEFFDTVFRTIREYLADRFHLASGGITVFTIEELVKEKNLNSEILDKIKKIFADCDMARYALSDFGQQRMQEIFQNLKQVIDYLERQKI